MGTITAEVVFERIANPTVGTEPFQFRPALPTEFLRVGILKLAFSTFHLQSFNPSYGSFTRAYEHNPAFFDGRSPPPYIVCQPG